MENKEIYELVKKLEPYFYGYKAFENRLKNDVGMEFIFRSSWNGKTSVLAYGGRHRHEIGCSFKKSVEKIVKDIKKRLLPEYREDFYKSLQYKKEREEKKSRSKDRLDALAKISKGEIRTDHFNTRPYIDANEASIFERYSGDYELTLRLNFGDLLNLLPYLVENKYITENLE